jgi:uncharacterized protein YkwD
VDLGRYLRAVGCALLVIAAAGCADFSIFGSEKPDPATQMPALESRIYDLVLAQRQKLDPKAQRLLVDPELVDVARKRSSAMAKANSFSTGDDPHASATLLMAEDAKFQGLVGENVAAQHFTPKSDIDVDAFAQRFVETWLASKPHEENLSFADYQRTGVGAAINNDTIYVTQLFVTDLGMGPQKDGAATSQVESVASPQQGKDDSQLPLRGAIVPGASQE